MEITLLKAKIHRAVVKQADLDYVGSITIDSDLLRESGIMEYEKVEIADIDNGNRFETYAIAGEAGSGIICLNGAAARCVSEGDKIIIMAYARTRLGITNLQLSSWMRTIRSCVRLITRSTDCWLNNKSPLQPC